ncbi:MAG: hypothetical protein A2Z16_07295 [Chloroflexi bacterium RBG_16_54_18]|nr:MAG: hypothetical protein A2Z16_07295 [Chloroflexi bacterium RBG_16_54_18]
MHENTYPPSSPKPNPLTRRKHRQEVLWQITLPLALGAILVLAAGVGVVYAGATQAGPLERWASTSIIWLIIPMMVLTLILLGVTAGLAYGIVWLIGALPKYTRQIQDVFVLIDARVRKAADASVEPTLRVRSFTAGLRALRRK